MKRIAIVCAKGLGDGLISMVLSHNFFLAGYDVTTFSTPLYQLARWFPDHKIEPFPDRSHQELLFTAFDSIIASDHSFLSSYHHPRLTLLKEKDFNPKKTLVTNIAEASDHYFALDSYSTTNGITLPQNIILKPDLKRVVIHPEASDAKKIWPQKKFVMLVNRLKKLGWKCAICVSQDERPKWEKIAQKHDLECPIFPSLDALAIYIAESAYLIGNDSGLGHLASALGIPTLSIFAKKRYARLWRPGWALGHVISPLSIPFCGRLRQKYWKYLLSTRQVMHAFHALVAEKKRRINASASSPSSIQSLQETSNA